MRNAWLRIYRAFVESPDVRTPELTVFVEGCTRAEAVDRVKAICKTLGRPEDGFYNLSSGRELRDENVSQDDELRLFETGWSDGKPTYSVRHPIFAVSNPVPLMQKWAAAPINGLSQVNP